MPTGSTSESRAQFVAQSLFLLALTALAATPVFGQGGQLRLPQQQVPLLGLPAWTESGPNAFALNGTYYATTGNVEGGIYIDPGFAPALCGVTDEPAIWTLGAGNFVEYPLLGTEILAGGADIKCSPECATTLAQCFALTDAAAAGVIGGILTQWPLESRPEWSAVVAACDAPPPLDFCLVSLNVVTANNVLHTIIDGIDYPYAIPTDLVEAPLSFTNGPTAGVALIRGTPASAVDVIVGGGVTTTTFVPPYFGYQVTAAGLTINTGGGAVNVPLSPGAVVVPFAPVPGPMAFNFFPCHPSIIGVSMGWAFGALQCPGVEIEPGPLGLPPANLARLAQRQFVDNRPESRGAPIGSGGAEAAMITLMGPAPAPYRGSFDTNGLPDANGWTFADLSVNEEFGSYGRIWPVIEDASPWPEARNPSPQVAFIDDPRYGPGPGSIAFMWPYAPGGWLPNTTGGANGGNQPLANAVVSPVIELPTPLVDGLQLTFTAYAHETLRPTFPGLLYTWEVRSQADGDGWSPWRDRGLGYYGGPGYFRHQEQVGDLLVPGAVRVQVRLGVVQEGHYWGALGHDGSPGPYFDDVRVDAYVRSGPAIHVREMDQAQDAFPADGVLDFINLGNNHVPVDMARSTAVPLLLANTPGDALECLVAPRSGATLTGPPTLHYRLTANHLFDAWRLPGSAPTGVITGVHAGGNLWRFDLADIDLMFPGDVLRYYIQAQDDLNADIATSSWPATFDPYLPTIDTPGIWDEAMTMRALPSMHSATPGDQPPILLWVDSDNTADLDVWRSALWQLGYAEGVDYDVYRTKGGSSAVGSGLGSRATLATIEYYDTIIYESGDMPRFTLSDGGIISGDPSNDLALLEAWLAGGRNLLATGNGLAGDVARFGAAGMAFVSNRLGLAWVEDDVRGSIAGQSTPLVRMLPGNPLALTQDFVAWQGSEHPLETPRIEALPGAIRLAEFTSFSGDPGVYDPDIAAMVYNESAGGARCVHVPRSFMSWYDPQVWTGTKSQAKTVAPPPARAELLRQILAAFGSLPTSMPTGVPAPTTDLLVSVHPNPFNPAGEIAWKLAVPGELVVSVYSVRGELVRRLHNGPVAVTEGRLLWRGDDEAGRAVASGIYFYEVKAAGQVAKGKLTLVR